MVSNKKIIQVTIKQKLPAGQILPGVLIISVPIYSIVFNKISKI
jgi:hypothetical protein